MCIVCVLSLYRNTSFIGYPLHTINGAQCQAELRIRRRTAFDFVANVSQIEYFKYSYYNIFCLSLSIYNQIQIERCYAVKNEPLVIKKRGEDGNRIISVRIKEETLAAIDKLAAETNYSRNELINLILAHGVENIEIQ